MQNSSLKNHVSVFVRFTASPSSAGKPIHRFTLLFLIIALLLPTMLYAAPQQSNYCYLPPFVTDPNTTPNVMFVFEKSGAIGTRAYSTTYVSDADNPYQGFFDSRDSNLNLIYYKFTVDGSKNFSYFEKSSTCTTDAAPNRYRCISGDILSWALTTSLDLARKVLVGFGWPKDVTSQGAGDVYTYSGNFCSAWNADHTSCTTQDLTPLSYGQLDEGSGTSSASVSVTVNISGIGDYTYKFCISEGNPESFVTVNGQAGITAPSCPNPNNAAKCNTSGTCLGSGPVAMKFTDEDRKGIIQQYADKDSNYTYDSDAPRFGLRRWRTSTASAERDWDILCDDASSGACTSTTKTTLLKEYLNAFSKVPAIDDDNDLGTMMKDIIKYFKDGTAETDVTYRDRDSTYTQTPYKWSSDPAKNCRKSFVIFVTTGEDLTGGSALTLSDVVTACDSLTYSDEFVKATCYGFNKDHYTADGNTSGTGTVKQNLRTYVVHTTFYGSGAANAAKLTYAAKTVGGGEYLSVDNPANLKSKIEEALLNILSTSASASTVATLTTQTRESSTLTQAYFFPKRENTSLRWTGYLRLLWSDSGANLREDTALSNTGWLDLKRDNILSFYYDPTIVAYKGRTFTVANTSPYLTIDTCDPSVTANVTTKLNDNILAIWNAQDKLVDMDFSTADKTRNIKIGIGNTSGVVTGSNCTTTDGSAGCNVFSTNLKATLQPFWSYSNYCSNYTSRWCNTTADCRYCAANPSTRTCLNGTNAECNYCSGNTALVCSADADCLRDYSPCGGVTAGKCDGDSTRSCSAAADCIDNYGTCTTTDTCTISGFTCNVDCTTDNCAYQVIRYVQGYDFPKNFGGSVASPGSGFRVRSQCTPSGTECTGGTCENMRCRSTGATCTLDSQCSGSPGNNPGDVCVGTCSSASYDVTKTLKLGDIVYSTPRISPNSAVNGYDVTYTDGTYTNFKGSTTVTEAKPIVIVGANDGMVHAFQVSKIKDLDPPSETAQSDTTSPPGDGISYQPARFTDYPPTSDTLPDTNCASGGCLGKELWAYIPYNAVPYLRWYCEEAYCHIPMVDARFTVVDASIDYNKNGFGSGSGSATDVRTCAADGTNCVWRRLLIGAMGIGGRRITVGNNTWSSSVFVLDITDTENPKLLWERPLPDNTLTTGTPALVRLGDSDKNGTWYLVFGSGPTSVTTNTVNYTSGYAKIYVFDLRTGGTPTELSIGASGVAVGDMLAVDMDSDYQTDVIYFGTYGGTGTSPTGKFYRLRIREGASYDSPASWNIETLVDTGRPMFASPEIALDASSNKWLYFGTGVYLALEHASPTAYCTSVTNTPVCTSNADCTSGTCAASPTSTNIEYLYGVKEPDACWQSGGASCTYSTPSASFLDTTNISFINAKAVSAGCFCAGQLMTTISCNSSGVCGSAGDCGANKVCANNTSQSCSGTLDSVDTDCPADTCVSGKCTLNSGRSCTTSDDCRKCIENKVVLTVSDATISGTGIPTTPNNCTGLKDTAAIACIEANINASNGCSSAACKGWRREIKGQKSFSKPFVAGGLVDYTSYQPTTTVCSLGGNAHLLSLHYTTGTPYVQPTILSLGGTSGETTSLTINASVNLGTGVPPLGESLVALPLAGDTYKVITQVSGGLPGTSLASSLTLRSGYVLWRVR